MTTYVEDAYHVLHAASNGVAICGDPLTDREARWVDRVAFLRVPLLPSLDEVRCSVCEHIIRENGYSNPSVSSRAMEVRVNAYDVMARAVEEGVACGWERANKYRQVLPSGSDSDGLNAKDTICEEVLQAICTVFKFPLGDT